MIDAEVIDVEVVDVNENNNDELKVDMPKFFHLERNDPNTIIGIDGTVRAKSFSLRKLFLWKGYIARIDDTTGKCLICDCNIVVQKSNLWCAKLHIIMHHQHCSDYEQFLSIEI